MPPLREFQRAVLSLPDQETSASSDHLLCRLQQAVRGIHQSGDRTGFGDIAVLLRQAMLRSRSVHGEDDCELRVPRGGNWPTEEEWRTCGCNARLAGADHYLVSPDNWTPLWLDSGAPQVVEAATKEIARRHAYPVPSDPLVVDYAGLKEYLSPGQRAAVRATFLVPPGSTSIVSLPTGAGKTLAFQLPALASSENGCLSVVVVPTVALAKDQEERFRNLRAFHYPCPLAYHSGLTDEERSQIRSAIRNGTIPIIFASPEAVMGSLRAPLFDAAKQGRLKLFAVDEAHVVAQWGQQFRPEFQSIAGLKDALLEACPPTAKFRTLLTTATLTPECHETLKFLFGRGGCHLISEAALRLEPGFLLYSAADEADRTIRILEAVRYLPRPLILYTTLREHAESWFYRLLQNGYQRIRMVRGGDLDSQDGAELLRGWRQREIDIIVATSAFGLGIDQAEVRSIVHACLPETVDRYYQEVGRSGRDGKASVCLLVTTERDVSTAEALAIERLISVDRAFQRWEAMWVGRTLAERDTYIVSLDDRPADIADTSIRNASWNLRTLVLMARSGLITFAPNTPPDLLPLADEDVTHFEERRRLTLQRFSRTVALRIQDSRHWDKSHWDQQVADTRFSLRANDDRGSLLVKELRHLERPLNDIFREVYTLSAPSLRPARVAGSCPITRRSGLVSFNSPEPELIVETALQPFFSEELRSALSPCFDNGRYWISCSPPSLDTREHRKWHDRIVILLRHLVSGGVVELSVPNELLSEKEWSQLTARTAQKFLLRTNCDAEEDTTFQVPRVSLLDANSRNPKHIESALMLNRAHHIIIVPEGSRDPIHPTRNLLDMVRHITVEDLIARLQS